MPEESQNCGCAGEGAEEKDKNCCSGNSGNSAADAGKMLPEKAQKPEANHGRKFSPIGVLVVILLLGFLLWLMGGKKDYQGAATLMPAGVSSMFSINCNDEVRGQMAALPLWKDGAKSADRVFENLASGFASADKSGLWRKLMGFCKWLTRAKGADDAEIYILETGNLHEVEDIICNEIATGFVKDRDTIAIGNITPVRKLQFARGEYYFAKMGTSAVVSDSKEALQKISNCYHEKETSLAKIGVGLVQGEMDETAFLSYFVPTRKDPTYFVSILAALGGDKSCRSDAGVATRIKITPDGVVTQTTIVNNEEIASAGEGHGFFYYVAAIIVLLLAIVIGIPGLFVLVTLAMAGYFYLVARWKGELVPIDPPELPEMSPQMKEDLQGKPADEPKKEEAEENKE